MGRREGRIRVGTCGYDYPHFRGVLYPPGLPRARWLPRYAEVFDSVELDATFYRLPTAAQAARWRARTPPGFVFACKGSRYLTHLRRLRETGEGLARFFAPLQALGDALAVVLWQLPPQQARPDPERLDRFARALPRTVRHAFEFRAEGWYHPEICAVLDGHGLAFCEHDLVARAPPRCTGGFRYLRFHGATAGLRGRYGRRALEPWARSLAAHRAAGGEAFVYFNNDTGGAAVRDAGTLLALLAPASSARGEAPRDRGAARETVR